MDAPAPDVRHAATIAALRDGGAGLDLPPRLSLFGHTRLPATEVELLGALGECRDVHLYLPQASPALWDALGGVSGPSGPVAREDDESAQLVGHPLLASLGRDARELRRSLDGAGFPDGDAVAPPADDRPSLLGLLQDDLRANHAPTIDERAGRHHDPADRSLQVHACHGPSRQVDVLREVLVGLLQDDPTLEPRDILVMCPDIETYAPLISAGFGLAPTVRRPLTGSGSPGTRRTGCGSELADRALASTNPLLAVAGVLLELSGGRVTASRGARPRRHRAVPAPVRLHRRRPRAARPLGREHRRPVGSRPGGAARRSRWTSSRRTPGAPASTGSCWASR